MAIPSSDLQTAPLPPAGTPQVGRGTSWYVGWGCALLLFLACCVCVLCPVLSVAGLTYLAMAQVTDNPRVDHELPAVVHKGEEFDLVLTLTNTSDQPITVGNIWLYIILTGHSWDGAAVLETEPHMEIDYTDDGIFFNYNQAIPPGESREVKFHLLATEAGELEFQIYVGSGTQFAMEWAHITILEE